MAASPDIPHEDWRSGGFGIYLHWPFCQAKCPYCDFNSHVVAQVDHARWQSAFLSEIDRHADLVPGRVVNSIFFGGGTPSLMPPALVGAIIDRIRARWPMANDVEITLEANPTSSETQKFRDFAHAGVNRLSLGVQAMNDRDLQRLGRLHDLDQALAAFDMARETMGRVSFDLIYARQDQSLDDWRAELERALALAVDHISLYQLTIEDGTAFGDRFRRGGLKGLPSDDLSAELYALTQEIAGAAGYSAYEVSNLARRGAESLHNQVYWRYGDYVGIGPGAHGRLTLGGHRHATEAPRMPGAWLEAVAKGRGDAGPDRLDRSEEAEEFLLMGLRLSEGIDLNRFERLAGHPLPPARITGLEEIGMLKRQDNRIIATTEGRMVLNSVLAELMRDA
ncbi:radical SAM family heme chaperone HemW [Pseudooceanicola sp. LIPI14-2-Ac024]|uniref:radical SAM family heme chaperone HemW n=1 Tax=Pseudooceanicola sp. LIPI14-2-Ac024 TaxID=3344875 RepID=UPI0035D037E7